MQRIMSAALGLALLVGPSVVRAEDHKGHKHDQAGKAMQGDSCQKHCSGMQLRGEVDALEKELKQVQASGGKLIEVNNKKEAIKKHIAQHQAELNDLQARVDGKSVGSTGSESMAMYHCPMHPNQKSDKQGKCPECGMKMEKVK